MRLFTKAKVLGWMLLKSELLIFSIIGLVKLTGGL